MTKDTTDLCCRAPYFSLQWQERTRAGLRYATFYLFGVVSWHSTSALFVFFGGVLKAAILGHLKVREREGFLMYEAVTIDTEGSQKCPHLETSAPCTPYPLTTLRR
jgi:hypothetical protein